MILDRLTVGFLNVLESYGLRFSSAKLNPHLAKGSRVCFCNVGTGTGGGDSTKHSRSELPNAERETAQRRARNLRSTPAHRLILLRIGMLDAEFRR